MCNNAFLLSETMAQFKNPKNNIMTNYLICTKTSNFKLTVNEPYNTSNIIKNINGSAYYFFNGFERIVGTNEIAIKLIRANEHFTDYTNLMYDGKRKNIKFSDKYEFVNFNQIKDKKNKKEIAEAIKIKDFNGYDEMFEERSFFDESFNTNETIFAMNTDSYTYKKWANTLDEQLEGFVKNLIILNKKDDNLYGIAGICDTSTGVVINDSSCGFSNGESLFYNNPYGNTITIRDQDSSSLGFNINNGTTSMKVDSNNPTILSNHKRKNKNRIILETEKLIIL